MRVPPDYAPPKDRAFSADTLDADCEVCYPPIVYACSPEDQCQDLPQASTRSDWPVARFEVPLRIVLPDEVDYYICPMAISGIFDALHPAILVVVRRWNLLQQLWRVGYPRSKQQMHQRAREQSHRA